MNPSSAREPASWFRSTDGRRYGRDIALIVALKIILLIALYVLFVAPQPRADSSADALRRHLMDSTPSATEPNDHDRP